MKTDAMFKKGSNRAVCSSRHVNREGSDETEIIQGDDSTLLPQAKPSWGSFAKERRADADFMTTREDVISNAARVNR
ncbi:AbrB/MazE/SpoVT family DNA-binding domain-containing protein [Chimaeribacter arupi]|uniref:AbrB/MazE/SpoVT family DNA-binding domain-containing protein n=1 Tax=Chimaeribacter arupi TaxID=2060066 RepID=A0A2N5EI83_9GAMM|nr:AbrB/MazE/SpoVT family DNA-binding domain-containing protein [Chimaeribacter arupi]PLR42407.1 AbrB/MazE/SpoVT family DNA-binding domain-containing protein [Chimaeribacter arupi]PLR44346.1 AbrB/MazE/SpoVT family DNA-binding domain-containing protein [Chimaeribacter arupi]